MTGVVTDVSGALLPNTTVVLSNPHTALSFTQTTDSKGSYRFTNIPPGQGYVATFQQLPASVTHAYVLRDTPEIQVSTLACVDRARAHRRDAGKSCAVPSKTAILPDPAAAAAQQLGGRFKVLDLNSFFCDKTRCYPVIGGVLVYKDITHLTPEFATTLAPYLQRAVRQAG